MFKRFLPFLLIGIVILLVIGLVINFILTRNVQRPTTAVPATLQFPQAPTTAGSLSQLVAGESTTNDVAKLAKPLKKERLSNSDTRYTFSSTRVGRVNEVVVSGNTVNFVRIITPNDGAQQGYAVLVQYTQTYGQPDKIIAGTEDYSYPLQTYIYSTKGFALIINPTTTEVYEVQKFQPMSVQNYLNSYGKNIQINQSKPENITGQ